MANVGYWILVTAYSWSKAMTTEYELELQLFSALDTIKELRAENAELEADIEDWESNGKDERIFKLEAENKRYKTTLEVIADSSTEGTTPEKWPAELALAALQEQSDDS